MNARLVAAILDSAKQGILPLQGILLDKSNKNRSLDLPLSSAFEIRLRKMRTTDDFSQILYPKNCARTVICHEASYTSALSREMFVPSTAQENTAPFYPNRI